MKKYLIILSLSLPLTASAQDSPFTREVEIERDYTPSVGEATRLTSVPQLQEAAEVASEADYSVWSGVAEMNPPLQPLPATAQPAPNFSRGDRFIRLGVGNYMSFLGDLFVPIINNGTTNWLLDARHRSTFGDITLDNDREVQAKSMTNRIHTAISHRVNDVILSADAFFNRRDYNYYGANSFIPSYFPEMKEKAHYNHFGIGAGLRSLYSPENTWDYNAALHYEYFGTQADMTEHHITLQGGFLRRFDDNKLGLNTSLDVFSYANAPQYWNNIYDDEESGFENYIAFKLNPYYDIAANALNIHLGLNVWLSNNRKYNVAASPDVKITLDAIEDRLQLMAYAVGDYSLNSAARIAQENPYMHPEIKVADTYTPLDFGVGAKVKITDNIIARGSLGYKYIKNEYFYHPFVSFYENNNYIFETGIFGVLYQENWQLYSNMSLEWSYSDRFNTLLMWNYNHWNNDANVWHKPHHEIRLSGNYKITDRLNLAANVYVATGRFKGDNIIRNLYIWNGDSYEELSFNHDPIIDFSLGGSYRINDTFTGFVQANNIFATKYQNWFGYNAHRFNAMAGVTIAF
jgi:hypothetical protein